MAVAGCAGPLSTLDPAGPQADAIARLGWLMLAMSVGVVALVVGLLGWALWRGRRPRPEAPSPLASTRLVVAGGIVLPLLVLPIVWLLSLQAMGGLAAPPGGAAVEVEVTGRQFGYEVRYPGHEAALLDEVRIPAGAPVLLRLASVDVIHSFWVPRLGGKMDLVPGQLNEMWLQADEPGTYEGRCAEFCGIGHTAMRIVVVAMEPADFEAWLAAADIAAGADR